MLEIKLLIKDNLSWNMGLFLTLVLALFLFFALALNYKAK
jgi:hypothetical protein